MSPRKNTTYSSRPNMRARAAHARGHKQFSNYDVSAIQPKRKKLPIIIAIVVVVVVLGLLITTLRGCLCSSGPTVPKGTEVTIEVVEGSTVGDIADSLTKGGLIGNPNEFVSAVKSLGLASDMKPGTYVFEAGISASDMAKQIAEGPKGIIVVVPEGKTVAQTAAIFDEATNGQIKAATFKELAASASTYESEFPFVKGAYDNSLEGFLFPKTYQVMPNMKADDVIRMMLKQFSIETEGLDYSYPEKNGLSQYQALILASIVEKEATGDEKNRAQVAGVFYNRLTNNAETAGYLQSDATTAYVIGDDPKPEDLKVDGPYNTYTRKGLPAGPICSPGLSSLQAVCNPTESDYLFFYFKTDKNGDLQYYFSKTYDEHQKAIANA